MYYSDDDELSGGVLMGGCAMCGHCPYDGGVLMGGAIKGAIKISTLLNSNFIRSYYPELTSQALEIILKDPSANMLSQIRNLIPDEQKVSLRNLREKLDFRINLLKSGVQFITKNGYSIPINAPQLGKKRATHKLVPEQRNMKNCTQGYYNRLAVDGRGRPALLRDCGVTSLEQLRTRPVKGAKKAARMAQTATTLEAFKFPKTDAEFIRLCNPTTYMTVPGKYKGLVAAGCKKRNLQYK